MLNIVIFTVAFVYLTQMALIKMFAKSFLKPKETILPFKDKHLLKKLQKITGINFDIKIIKSEKFFGAMHGIPTKPVMTLSTKALEILDKGQIEWVVLHEAGHCLGYHVVILIVSFMSLLISGIYFISHSNSGLFSVLVSLLVAFTLNIIYQQKANIKFKKRALKYRSVYNSEILLFLFAPHISYSNRILMARNEIERRK